MIPLGIFGGTFDPVHFGHLRTALELLESFNLDEVRLIPCHRPPHREIPITSSDQRLAMLKLAVADTPGLIADDRELRRSDYSYTVDTLLSLKADFPAKALLLFVGSDAFCRFKSWYKWRKILQLANLVVVRRAKTQFSLAARQLLAERRIDSLNDAEKISGHILVRELTSLDISSTAIRAAISAGKNPDFLLPMSVQRYIVEHSLYQGTQVK